MKSEQRKAEDLELIQKFTNDFYRTTEVYGQGHEIKILEIEPIKLQSWLNHNGLTETLTDEEKQSNLNKAYEQVLKRKCFDLPSSENEINHLLLSIEKETAYYPTEENEPFETIGVITDNNDFFLDKIAGYNCEVMREFVRISENKHFDGHEIKVFILDPKFEQRSDLLDFHLNR